MQDESLHEIQLNGKQLVFLFIAATVVAVVIFLCGVMVGRGVPLRASAAPLAPEQTLGDPTAAGRQLPPPPAVASTGTTPLTASETLTYPSRLADSAPEDDTLKPVAEVAAPAKLAASKPAPIADAPKPVAPASKPAPVAAVPKPAAPAPKPAPIADAPKPAAPAPKPAPVADAPKPAVAAPKPAPPAAAAPAPAAPAPKPAPVADAPKPAVAAPKPAPPAAAAPAPAAPTSASSAASPGSGFVVQVAAVRTRADADAIAQRLSAKGYPTFVTTAGSNFRVRVGTYTNRAEAEAIAGRLEREERVNKPWVTR
jgi:septal ring-binding cell division protein DamX